MRNYTIIVERAPTVEEYQLLRTAVGWGKFVSKHHFNHYNIQHDILVSKCFYSMLGDIYMAHQMTVTLSDQEYVALKAEAAKSGRPLDDFLREVLTQHIQQSIETHTLSRHDIQNYLYKNGVTEHIPTYEPDTMEEEAERENLSRLFGQGKPVSEMVIEDRGPW